MEKYNSANLNQPFNLIIQQKYLKSLCHQIRENVNISYVQFIVQCHLFNGNDMDSNFFLLIINFIKGIMFLIDNIYIQLYSLKSIKKKD